MQQWPHSHIYTNLEAKMKIVLRKTSTAVLAILAIFLIFKIFASQALAVQAPVTAAGTGGAGEVKLQIIGACNFYIDPYWNLISLCAIPSNKSVNSVFSPVNYRYIMRWNETSQQFDVYSPRAAENPFTEVEENKSYFIYLEGSQTLFQVSGALYNDTNVSMVQYWNSPIYPYEFPTTIEKQISSVRYTHTNRQDLWQDWRSPGNGSQRRLPEQAVSRNI